MVNKVILVGRVGKDPDVRHLDSGVAKASFTLATDESYKNRQGERVTQTEWHNLIVWRQLAEIVEKYVRKGSLLYVEGRIRSRSYDDASGNRRYITEIDVDNLRMLDSRRAEEGAPAPRSGGYSDNASPAAPSAAAIENIPEGPDDLPF